jgi:hypothetical protein
METMTAAARRRRTDVVLWAAGVAWVGALAALPAAVFLDLSLQFILAVGSAFAPQAVGADPTAAVLVLALTAMATCLVSALGSAWVLATTAGPGAPAWLLGSASGVLGWLVGAGVAWVLLSA